MSDKLRELVEEIDGRFRSGNAIPVDRVWLTQEKWNELRALIPTEVPRTWNDAFNGRGPMPAPLGLCEFRKHHDWRGDGICEACGAEWPDPHFFASGPEGSFFTTTLAEAENLIDFASFDRDDWTVTDLHNPTGTTPTEPAPDREDAERLDRWSEIAREGTDSDWQMEQSHIRRWFAARQEQA